MASKKRFPWLRPEDPPKPRRGLSEEHKRKNRENGRKGGRPRKAPKPAASVVATLRQRARSIGEESQLQNVLTLIAVRDGLMPGSTVRDRMEAANSLMDRYGDSRRQQNDTGVPLPTKLIDFTGWDAPADTGHEAGTAGSSSHPAIVETSTSPSSTS